jgi:hypothetical protein
MFPIGNKYMRNIILDSKNPISIEYLQEFSRKTGMEIPDELIGFFCKFNGGHPKYNMYYCADGEKCELHEFLYIGTNDKKGTFEDTIEYLILDLKIIPHHLVPFAIDGGGDLYCISTAKDNYGKIYFFWTEFCDHLDRAIEYVAPSLDEFIENMK